MKYYAVKVGRVPGIYTTWNECQAQVNKFSGAVFKSFDTLSEVNAYMGVETIPIVLPIVPFPSVPQSTDDDSLHIYTDGSHQRSKGYLGIGAWIKYKGREYNLSLEVTPQLLSEYGISNDLCSNPTAEFLAFAEVIRRITHIRRPIVFYNDYIGIQMWMTGMWNANESYIIKIRDMCINTIKMYNLYVSYVHVKGHSGVEGNEKADKLAGGNYNIDEIKNIVE